MERKNTDKVAELQIITWFLEAGWQVYTPVVDLGVDAVVRPGLNQSDLKPSFLTVQIKHRKDDSDTDDPGYLNKNWVKAAWNFDCMIILCPCLQKGLILPQSAYALARRKANAEDPFLELDANGLARGDFSPWVKGDPLKDQKDLSFDVSGSGLSVCKKYEEFINRFIKIMKVT